MSWNPTYFKKNFLLLLYHICGDKTNWKESFSKNVILLYFQFKENRRSGDQTNFRNYPALAKY